MSGCPDYLTDCLAPDSEQTPLTVSERGSLMGRAARFGADAEICAHCALVFTRNPLRRLGRLRGRFEALAGWD
jgi:hypothetical protein